MSVDFQPPPTDPAEAARAVKAPAILMIVGGAFGVLGAVSSVFLNKLMLEWMRESYAEQKQPMPEMFEVLYGPLGLAWNVIAGLLSVVALAGAIRMLSLRSWGLAMAASICAILSCACCVIGPAAGIWGIIVLSRPEVKAAFAASATR